MHASPAAGFTLRRIAFTPAQRPDAHNVSAEDLKLLIPLNDPLPEVGAGLGCGGARMLAGGAVAAPGAGWSRQGPRPGSWRPAAVHATPGAWPATLTDPPLHSPAGPGGPGRHEAVRQEGRRLGGPAGTPQGAVQGRGPDAAVAGDAQGGERCSSCQGLCLASAWLDSEGGRRQEKAGGGRWVHAPDHPALPPSAPAALLAAASQRRASLPPCSLGRERACRTWATPAS